MLALGGEAVPHLTLEAREVVCRARGLDGQEIVVTPEDDLDLLVIEARAAARVLALRVPYLAEATAPALARASRTLAVPVSVPAEVVEAALLDRMADVFERVGGRLLLAHRTDLGEVLSVVATVRARETAALGLAWDLEPSTTSLDDASAVLLATADLLGLVRLHGGGPEQRGQDGRGLGSLVGELAVSGYAGPIVLCPSSRDPAILERWARWAASRGSSGCGHASSAGEHAVDVRDVEPRDRLETILGAYRGLIPGATLQLTVDHDPTCMYYMLEATEPARSFEFQVVEHGPEVWRARVTKR